jgi:two-component system, cell cycle sensor histidine kinase and response regulator CckA
MGSFISNRDEIVDTANLQRRVDELEAVFAASPVMFWYKDDANRLIRVNPAAAAAEGQRPEEIEGKSCWDLYPKDQADAYFRDDQEVMTSRKPKLDIIEEHTAIGTGELRMMQVGKVPLIDISGKVFGVLAFATDITERVRFEERLRQVEKMEIVGRLAGSVAHDFNNLLAGVMGNAELLGRQLPAHDERQESVRAICEAAERAGELTRQLLLLSRKNEPAIEVIDTHQVVESVAQLLRRTSDQRVAVEVALEAHVPVTRADSTQLHGALLNLGLNARDAMPHGGRLRISSATARIDQPRSCQFGQVLQPATYVVLSVSDEGTGIAPETQPHLFKPFFTTKQNGHGTGLGLVSVLASMRDNGGVVTVTTAPHVGSTFSLWLPVADGQPQTATPFETQIPRGAGRILLVDDEQNLRDVGAKLLAELGYTTDVASDGVSALALLGSDPTRYKAVLLDVILPVMSGVDVFERIRHLAPQVPVIVVSAYSNARATLQAKGVDAILDKPYGLMKLAQALHHAIASRT